MRTQSLIAPLTIVVALALACLPLAATGDVERNEAGRSARTGPKGPQSRLDGLPVDLLRPPSIRESGRRIADGRHLSARPTEDVSVGLVGCPGCAILLQSLGGLFVEIERETPRNR